MRVHAMAERIPSVIVGIAYDFLDLQWFFFIVNSGLPDPALFRNSQ
jgi:hypothetical protein